jgi:hypothetical protein
MRLELDLAWEEKRKQGKGGGFAVVGMVWWLAVVGKLAE